MVNATFNKFGKKLPPVKTGQRFGEEVKKDKKVGLFSERRFLIFTKKGPIEIAFKPVHYTGVLITTIIGLTSIIYWSAKGIYSAIDVAKKNDIITEASANINVSIENDSDTNVNFNVEDQSNITFPILESMGLKLSLDPKKEMLTTPFEFEKLFPGSSGSLYGMSPHGINSTFKRPLSQSQIKGLFMAGGGTHPGAGVPMACQSGKHAAEMILRGLNLT